MKKISLPILKEHLTSFLSKYFDENAVQDCVDVILYAELHNKDGQGLLKLTGTEPLQAVKPKKPIEIEEPTKLSALISGHQNPSFHVAKTATDICIQKAKEHGFGIVGANGIYSSTGALGFYTEKAANQGLITYACARSPGAVAPFGLNVPLFGTNPFSWSFPTQGKPVVFDMATSAITFYELVLAKMRGQEIPNGLAIDKDGQITTNPTEAMEGGILPFDKGYKGSALAMMVELLSGPLVGSSYCDYKTFDQDWGFFILSFRPDLLVELDTFKKYSTDLVNIIRDNGAKVPGDNGHHFATEVLNKDYIEIEDQIVDLLSI